MSIETKSKQVAEPKQDPRDLVLGMLVGTLIAPFTGMVRALVFRLMWDWFIAPQYGEGPTLQTWFGIGVLYSMIFAISSVGKQSGDLPKNVIRHVIEHAFIGLMLIGVMIVAAAMARIVWGWR